MPDLRNKRCIIVDGHFLVHVIHADYFDPFRYRYRRGSADMRFVTA